MHLILISPPDFRPEEIRWLEAFFNAGLTRFHIRKPEAEHSVLYSYMNRLPAKISSASVLHYYFDKKTNETWNLQGGHDSSKQRKEKAGTPVHIELREQLNAISTSVHHPDELSKTMHYKYVFCSPVFPSISKPGHHPKSDWDINKIKHKTSCIALGGIRSSNIEQAFRKGFEGIALLGSIWNKPSLEEALDEFIKCKRECDRLS